MADKVVPLKKHENVDREEGQTWGRRMREKRRRKRGSERKRKRIREKKRELPPSICHSRTGTQRKSTIFIVSISPLPVLENEGENSLTTATDNPKISEGNSTESKTETVNRCQAGVELLEVSHTNETLKETAVSGSHSTKQKVTSEIAPRKIPAHALQKLLG